MTIMAHEVRWKTRRIIAVALIGLFPSIASATTVAARSQETCPGWSIVPAQTPSGAGGADLSSVVGISQTDAWAVGGSGGPGHPFEPLIEHWDGSLWTIVQGAA